MKTNNQPTHRKYKGQKIYTYVSVKDVQRLQAITDTYGFKSVYELQKYLVDCFLRVVDPANDTTNKPPVPEPIAEMFIHPREYRRLKRLHKKNKKPEFQLLIPFGEYVKSKYTKKLIMNEQGMHMADEIKGMFNEYTDWESDPTEKGVYDSMRIKPKVDQRIYKSPDDLK